jgi:hypothetical protein
VQTPWLQELSGESCCVAGLCTPSEKAYQSVNRDREEKKGEVYWPEKSGARRIYKAQEQGDKASHGHKHESETRASNHKTSEP